MTDIRRRAVRRSIASLATVTLSCLAATIQTAARGEWGWALPSAAVTVIFGRDLVDVARTHWGQR